MVLKPQNTNFQLKTTTPITLNGAVIKDLADNTATNLTVGSVAITNSAPIDTRAVRVASLSIDNVFESGTTTSKSIIDNKYYVKENDIIHINVNLSRGVTFAPPTTI